MMQRAYSLAKNVGAALGLVSALYSGPAQACDKSPGIDVPAMKHSIPASQTGADIQFLRGLYQRWAGDGQARIIIQRDAPSTHGIPLNELAYFEKHADTYGVPVEGETDEQREERVDQFIADKSRAISRAAVSRTGQSLDQQLANDAPFPVKVHVFYNNDRAGDFFYDEINSGGEVFSFNFNGSLDDSFVVGYTAPLLPEVKPFRGDHTPVHINGYEHGRVRDGAIAPELTKQKQDAPEGVSISLGNRCSLADPDPEMQQAIYSALIRVITRDLKAAVEHGGDRIIVYGNRPESEPKPEPGEAEVDVEGHAKSESNDT